MIQNSLKRLQSQFEAGADTSSLCDLLAESIEDVWQAKEFYALSPRLACKVLKSAPTVSIEIAKTILEEFHKAQGASALELLSSIECGPIGNRAGEVLKTFLDYPLLRELSAGSGSLGAAGTESQKREIEMLWQRIRELETSLDNDHEIDWKYKYEQEKDERGKEITALCQEKAAVTAQNEALTKERDDLKALSFSHFNFLLDFSHSILSFTVSL
jgi:hypothetical protein